MILRIWIFLLSSQVYALVTKPSEYATKSLHTNSPTAVPVHQQPPLITPAPEIDAAGIRARADAVTCAYVSGNPASPLTCPAGSSCTASEIYHPGWSCCDEIQCLGDYNQCVDYGVDLCPGLDKAICSQIYTSVLYCPSASPSCISYARSSSIGDFLTQYSLACGNSGGVVLARYLPTTGKGLGNEGEANPTFGGNPAPAQSTVKSQPTDVLDIFPSPVPRLSTGSPSSDSSDSRLGTGSSSSGSSDPGAKKLSADNSLSPGAIAAMVIAIVAIITTVIVAWWKRPQVVWCITCARYGSKHSKKSPKAKPYGNQLSTMTPHGQGNPGYPSQQFIIINGSNHQGFNPGR